MFNIYANKDESKDDQWIHKKRHWDKKEAIAIADSIFEDLNTSFDEVKVTNLVGSTVYRRSQSSQYWY